MSRNDPSPFIRPHLQFSTRYVRYLDGSRRLCCFIDSTMFTVDTAGLFEIEDLREAIRMRATDSLKDFQGPYHLDLWKVSAIDESRCEVNSPHFQPKDSNPILTKPSDTATEYIRSLGDSISNVADKFEPSDPLISICPSQPPIEHLHIVGSQRASINAFSPRTYRAGPGQGS
jgi:hypothetical protein